MSKIVPHTVNYDWMRYTKIISSFTLYSSALISLTILFMELFKICNPEIVDVLNKTLALLSITYFISEFCQSLIFHKAESKRNLDFIDNSFNTKFAEKNSSGYYSNDEVEIGIVKMGINGFENAFFTKSITAKMFKKELISFVIILVLFLAVCLYTTPKILIVISQMALPLAIIQQTIKLYCFHCRVDDIFFNYKSIFSLTTKENIIPSIIKNVISYEKTLSWAGIPLDSKIFNNMNDELSSRWIEIKEDHSFPK